MFDLVMGLSASELLRLADEVRACRERLQELLRVTAELKRMCEPEEPAGETARKLQSVP